MKRYIFIIMCLSFLLFSTFGNAVDFHIKPKEDIIKDMDLLEKIKFYFLGIGPFATTVIGGATCSEDVWVAGYVSGSDPKLITCPLIAGGNTNYGCSLIQWIGDYGTLLGQINMEPGEEKLINPGRTYEVYWCTDFNCACDDWVEQGCGQGSCDNSEMYFTRDCPNDCSVEETCSYRELCVSDICDYTQNNCPSWSTCINNVQHCTVGGCNEITRMCIGEPVCGNNVCEGNELTSCPGDCPEVCKSEGESCTTSPDTCCENLGLTCFEDKCYLPKSCDNDGKCEPGEGQLDCPQDCGEQYVPTKSCENLGGNNCDVTDSCSAGDFVVSLDGPMCCIGTCIVEDCKLDDTFCISDSDCCSADCNNFYCRGDTPEEIIPQVNKTNGELLCAKPIKHIDESGFLTGKWYIDKLINLFQEFATTETCSNSLTKEEFKKATDFEISQSICEEDRNCNPIENYEVDCVKQSIAGIQIPESINDKIKDFITGGKEPGVCLATSTEEFNICESTEFANFFGIECGGLWTIIGGIFLLIILIGLLPKR